MFVIDPNPAREVHHVLYSGGLTPTFVQHLLAPIKKRVHNGAVKSRGVFNYNLSTLLVTVFYNEHIYQIVFGWYKLV